jgi:hypothetical protein
MPQRRQGRAEDHSARLCLLGGGNLLPHLPPHLSESSEEVVERALSRPAKAKGRPKAALVFNRTQTQRSSASTLFGN